LRQGEILGLAGLVGSGRTELARALFGIDRKLGGEVRLNGKPVAIASPREAIDQGIFLVPEDRKRSGLLLDVSIAENISLPDLAHYTQAFLMQPAPEAENAEKQRKQLSIRTRSVHSAAGTLSGGNQQK